jgi:hypothetical protein
MSMLAVRSAYWPYVRGLLSPASMLPATRRRSSAWLLQERRNLPLASARISTERGHRSGRRGALGALVAGLLALTLAGCSGDSDAEPTAPPTTSATATPTPTTSPTASPSPVDEEAEAALEVYREFWAAVTEARSIPDATLPALSRYGSGTALTNEQEFLIALEREGVAYEGEPELVPEVTATETSPIPAVTVTDCIDSSDWRPIRLDTGESAAAPGQEQRFYTVSRVERFDDDWFVVEVETDRSRTC